MAATLGNAYVQILPSAKGISQNITKELGGSGGVASAGKSAGTSFGKSLMKTIAGLGIGAAAVKGLKEAFSEGAALQQSFGGLETIYGDAAEAAKKYAAEAAAMGISANSYAEQAVSFGASLKQAFGGDTTKAVEAANTAIMDMTDNAAKMGTPIENIQTAYQGFAKQNYTMLDNLKLGYGGTKTEMERLLKDASKLTGQKYDINNLGDVYDAIHVIQGELGLTGVAAEEAKTTFSGSFGAMQAAAKNFFGALTTGGDVSGTLTALISSAVTFVKGNLLPMAKEMFSALPGALMTVLSEYGPVAGEALLRMFQQGVAMLPKVFTDIADNINGIFGRIETSGLLNKGLELINTLAQGVISAFPSLVTSLSEIVGGAIRFIASNLPQFMQKGFEVIMNIRQGIRDKLPEIGKTMLDLVHSIITSIGDHLPEILETGIDLLGQLLAGMLQKIADLPATITKIVNTIKTTFSDVDWQKVGKDILEGIKSGITKFTASVAPAAKNVVSMIDKTLNFSGTIAKVRGVFDNIKNAITNALSAAKSYVTDAISRIKGAFNFSWSLPKLKLPHISVTGGVAPFGIGGKGSLPKFSIQWYRKAEDNPYIFSDATLFGAGERNDEILYGKGALMRDITKAVSKGSQYNYGDITINVYATEKQSAKDIADEVSYQINNAIRRKKAVWA